MTAGVEDQDEAEVWPPEDFPDGSFGHARLPDRFSPCTPDEQARHVAALLEGVAGFAVGPALHRRKQPPDGQRPGAA